MVNKIREHSLNIELSKEVLNNCKFCVKPKECYNNVFNILSYYTDKFRTGGWKVAYGYVDILKTEPLMARHCFIVSSDGQAIDPTVVSTSTFKEEDEKTYISFKIFDTLEEYLDTIEENRNDPSLYNHPDERNAMNWADLNNRVLIG
jgi:hypothetical protein